jgi:tetratricopeptide (TPR) repeat protein
MNPSAQTLEALYATGYWLIGLGRIDDALCVFRTMLLVDGRDERGWLGLATCHAERDELEKAIALCELASEACDDATRSLLACARLHVRAGEHQEAVVAYEEVRRQATAARDYELLQVIATEVP